MNEVKNKKCIICEDTYKSRISNYDGDLKGEMLCNKHLLQQKRNGKIIDPTKSRRREERVCDICGDTNEIRQFGIDGKYDGYLLCHKHYGQAREHGGITDETHSQKYKDRICAACGSEDDILYYAKEKIMLCRRHYSQKRNFGKIFERTIFDKNEINVKENIAEVVLYDGKQNETGRAIIDIENVDLIKNHKWRLNNWGYADSRINGSLIFMQNFIYGIINSGDIVDHIDRNPLNNKKSNLRLSNKSTNAINAGIRKSNTSGVTGVNFDKKVGSWRAYISFDGKRVELGHYKIFEYAVRARLQAESKYHKEFASQRHLFEEYGVL